MPMEENLRSGDRSGIVVKKRSSSGCLIVRKKGDAVCGSGSSGSRKGFAVKNERKRPRPPVSDSESSKEDLPLPPPPRRGVAAETIRVCNGLTVPGKHIAGDSELTSWNGEEKRKRNKLDVFEFDEYDGIDGEIMMRRKGDGGGIGKRFMGSTSLTRSGCGMEFESGTSRHAVVASRRSMYFDRAGSLSGERKRDVERIPLSVMREEYMNNSDKPIRVQGKNGVLKVHVNKKKKLGGSTSDYDWKNDDNRKSSRYDVIIKKNAGLLASSADEHGYEKHKPFSRMQKDRLNRQKFVPTETNESSEEDLGDSDMLLKQRSEEAARKNVIVYSSRAEKKRGSISRIDRDKLTSKISQPRDGDSDDANISLKRKSREVEGRDSSMKISLESEKTPKGKAVAPGKGVKRGSGTEKQKLRENIRNMLLSAGWEIDYKPRRNRDYLDAVYVSPSGTSYWSIIKAYDALQKQLDNETGVNGGDRSAFKVSDEILSQLTRKTQKKMEKELKKKQREGTESENTGEVARKKTSYTKEEAESTESDSAEEKLSSFMKQGTKSLKGKTNDSGSTGSQKKSAKVSSANVSLHGRKNRKLGRCTLLIRSSDKGSNSESDGFVPYTGKRTLLSWLIDSGLVELSQKVQYMNRRKTRVLLEGWMTRDGIHCGCCSKILTVSKFEIHAGSKLRQPFQNIYLESGASLLQCQIDAWNRQEESDREGFHSVDVDGDDPNDDTCGLCGDGGDLICCDGCPSTFHQSCLNIQMLPQGDWHCPNCTCRFCGSAGEHVSENHSLSASELLTCNLCERRFHKSCIEDIDVIASDSATLNPSFCSQKCWELFEHLQKYLGAKQELEGGFSWSLIRRTDPESDFSMRGLPQRVECNSKLAVALSIMDECFLPIVDRRTGINMIHNVLYNCGSNFSRINYGGFYTVVLERGDEIISAASLRFHGTQLAEMPFIGTRHIYRRQGMCRRLFSAIETALRSLKIEKLVIPAISELMHTWTVVFGFTPAVESLKQEMRSLNMLVFPGLDMLQKHLLEQETAWSKGTAASFSGAAAMELEEGKKIATNPLTSDKSDGDLSSEQVLEMGGKVEEMDSDPNSQGGSSNDTDVVNSSDDAIVHLSFELAVKSAESQLEQTVDAPSDSDCGSQDMEEKYILNPPGQDSAKPIESGDMNDSCDMKVEVSFDESKLTLEGRSLEKLKEVAKTNDAQIPVKCMSPSDVSRTAPEMEEKPVQAPKEEETTEEMDVNSEDVSASLPSNSAEPMPVNSDSNCQVSGDGESESEVPADGGACSPQDVEVGIKSVSSSEFDDSWPSSTGSARDDANKVN
ncbi:uncharacterized protein LOC116196501 [Punica granatum]|uniref:Uncharacterized protein LOC116196501 n=1 Tax=Punica granatum TaxID=22663 RepID=A0A6P8CDS5_PUNGR|nr:uncharacterized protein LOC116196501 [Punica granatum]